MHGLLFAFGWAQAVCDRERQRARPPALVLPNKRARVTSTPSVGRLYGEDGVAS